MAGNSKILFSCSVYCAEFAGVSTNPIPTCNRSIKWIWTFSLCINYKIYFGSVKTYCLRKHFILIFNVYYSTCNEKQNTILNRSFPNRKPNTFCSKEKLTLSKCFFSLKSTNFYKVFCLWWIGIFLTWKWAIQKKNNSKQLCGKS